MIKEMIGAVSGAFILMISIEYVVYQLVAEGEPINKKRYYLACIIQSLITVGINVIDLGFARVMVLYMLIVFGNIFVFRKKIIKIIMATFLAYVLMILAESIFSVIIIFLLKIDIQSYKENYGFELFSNIMIVLILLGLSKIKPLKNFLKNLIDNVNYLYINRVFTVTIITISILNLILYYLYFEVSALYTMILNLILILVYGGLTVSLLKESNDKVKMKTKYDNIINASEKYEKIIEQLRMSNHENKNNLIVLKGMLKSNNKKVKEYIDDLILEGGKEDNNLILKTSSIPTGGLQGIIYQKLLDMKDKNIEYHLDVSKNIHKNQIESIDVKTNKDLCTIVGIFLDNAIQATENIHEKNIGIYLYQEKNLFVISISNIYKGKIDLEKMSNKGYTTKEYGHGYGLSLVKEIVDKNKLFRNDKIVRGNVFVQKIILDLNIKK